MAFGIGHHYWVHQIDYFYGPLDECIKFMLDHKPDNPHKWFELRPDVVVKTGTCQFYKCALVEMACTGKKYYEEED